MQHKMFTRLAALTKHGVFIPPKDGSKPCGEYDPAGRDAKGPDGFPQCAACGHNKTKHRR